MSDRNKPPGTGSDPSAGGIDKSDRADPEQARPGDIHSDITESDPTLLKRGSTASRRPAPKPARIAVAGVPGRMGVAVIRRIVAHPQAVLAGALARRGSAAVRADAGILAGGDACHVLVSDSPDTVIRGAEVLIDFSGPELATDLAELCAESGVAYVTGTTGLSAREDAALERASVQTPVLHAPNFSVGVAVVLRALRLAARAFGTEADVEIVEMHHRHKVDAPSGTALRMGEVVAAAREQDLGKVRVDGREGLVGARKRGEIGFHSMRGGDVVGDHQVVFALDGERLEIGHRASDRGTFASGAVRAALWVRGRAPGRYTLEDVLGLG